MKSNYWSCTKFADWVRGTPKIQSGTASEWNAWTRGAKKKKIRYWISEKGLDYLQNFVNWPKNCMQNIRHYIDNRWIVKTHALSSTLKRGQWHDLDTRLLYAAFDELVNFVEVEQALMHVACLYEKEGKKYNVSFFQRYLRPWRSQEAGLDHLDWAASLTHSEEWIQKDDPCFGQPTTQALAAKETVILYKWWKEKRPKRLNPMDASGLDAYYDKKQDEATDLDEEYLWDCNDETEENLAIYRKMSEIYHKMDQKQDDEDTEMLIRLVKLRKHLWT